MIKYKKNIFFSRIWSFDKYLELFSNRINRNKILKVNLYWYDSVNEKRHSQIKKHDLKLRYNLDVFSHLMNLIEIITKQNIQMVDNYEIKKDNKNESVFSLSFRGIIFNFRISRIKKRRKRYIKLIDFKKNIHEINFSKDNIFLKRNNSKSYLYSYKSEGNLSKMLKCFLYKEQIKKININYGINYLRLHNKIFN